MCFTPNLNIRWELAASDVVLIKISLYRGDSTGALAVGRRHTGGDLTIDLPAGTDACDISTFTIWCEDFSVFFTRLEVPATLFVSALTINVVCVCVWGGGGGAGLIQTHILIAIGHTLRKTRI